MNASAESRATRQIVVALGVTTLAALGLAVVYLTRRPEPARRHRARVGARRPRLGVRRRRPQAPPAGSVHRGSPPARVEPRGHRGLRPRLRRGLPARRQGGGAETAEGIKRRKLITRMLGAAAGALGLAALFPIASLGPRPGNSLFVTKWRKGSRVVNEQGEPVKVDDLEVGGVITVFPAGHLEAADSQTVLIRLQKTDVTTRPGRETWGPAGYVAYSKVCTHAGLPGRALPAVDRAPAVPVPPVDVRGAQRRDAGVRPGDPLAPPAPAHDRRDRPPPVRRATSTNPSGPASGTGTADDRREGRPRARQATRCRPLRAHRAEQGVPGPLVVHDRRDRHVLPGDPDPHRRLPDVLLRPRLAPGRSTTAATRR